MDCGVAPSGARRVFSLGVPGGIGTHGEIAATADRSRRGTADHPSRRHFGALDDDFDLPPLDLSTPSLSIPLPPNLIKDSVGINGEKIGDRGRSVGESGGRAEVSEPERTPAPSSGDAGEAADASFLSRGIEKMRRQQGLSPDGRLTSDQRGKLEHALTAKRGGKIAPRKEHEAAAPIQAAAPDRRVLSLLEEIASMGAADRGERLALIKGVIAAELKETFSPSNLGPAPQLLDEKRTKWLSKLTEKIKDLESALLSDGITTDEEGALAIALKMEMRQLFRLREYGVTPTQYRRMKKDHSAEQRKDVLERRRQQFYAEAREGLSSANRLDDPPVLRKPTAPACRKPSPDFDAQPRAAPAVRPWGVPGSFTTPGFDGDMIATQADGAVLGRMGGTSVLSTVVLAGAPSSPHSPGPGSDDGRAARDLLLDAVRRADAESGATFVPLQVDYRERHHASGKIPGNRRRRDNTGPLSDREVLASRVVDRTIRPWLMMGLASGSSSSSSAGSVLPENIVVNCEVQSYDPRPFSSDSNGRASQRTHADPTALAVNSAIAALYRSAYSSGPGSNLPLPVEAAACVKLAILRDGTAVINPAPDELDRCRLELLYAGTRDRALMLEFAANSKGGLLEGEDPGVDEGDVADALRLACEAIVPIIERQEELRDEHANKMETRGLAGGEELMTDDEVARLLGLETPTTGTDGDGSLASVDDLYGATILVEANTFVWSRVKHVALKLFGYDGEEGRPGGVLHEQETARVHNGDILSKKVRGRREKIMRNEITRLLRDDFAPHDMEMANLYQLAVREDGGGADCIGALSDHVHEVVMKRALAECAERQLRADGRMGLNVVRPISAVAPIFADSVHGSALFSRGETQVLCTVTVGAPKEGLPLTDPYSERFGEGAGKGEERGDDEKVPVGSLRFLRNQAELESDMNSRRVLAGREMTGDSGILSEVKRAFLHYDFPDYSTGVVRSRVGAGANRRAIGHGNLAEKAILPALPHPDDFPYAIRLTSEVTSSNGSSSMASACGASLALLDAGVPLVAPVAGVSVGLAPGSDDLLLDITGTEDHYGDMDFKICGTYGGITAMQLDVKRPLPVRNLHNALDFAKEGRWAILNAMENECKTTLPSLRPRTSMKSTAPRVEVIKFDPNRKRDLIGPGGAVLRQLEDRFKISLDLSQEGRCLIFGSLSSVSKARNVIMDLVSDVEEGGVYEGTVIEIKDFGAVIELLRNKEGLLHVSEITDSADRHPGGNIGLVKSHFQVGDKIEVLCTKIDHVQGSIKLSRKKLLQMRRNNTFVPRPIKQGDQVFPFKGGALELSRAQIKMGAHVSNHNLPAFPSDAKTDEIDSMDGDDIADNGSSPGNMAGTDGTEDDFDSVPQWMNDNSEYRDEDGHVNNDTCGDDVDGGEIGHDTDGCGDDTDEYGADDGDFDEDIADDDVDDVNSHVSDEEHVDRMSDKTVISNGASLMDARWMDRYNELQKFKSDFSHCNVKRRDKGCQQLYNWIGKQRAAYKHGRLPDDRVKLLDAIGFEWSQLKTSNENLWNERFHDLEHFKREFGHCNVKRTDKERQKLGYWVSTQRKVYRTGCMPDDRVQRLNDIGFEWSLA